MYISIPAYNIVSNNFSDIGNLTFIWHEWLFGIRNFGQAVLMYPNVMSHCILFAMSILHQTIPCPVSFIHIRLLLQLTSLQNKFYTTLFGFSSIFHQMHGDSKAELISNTNHWAVNGEYKHFGALTRSSEGSFILWLIFRERIDCLYLQVISLKCAVLGLVKKITPHCWA